MKIDFDNKDNQLNSELIAGNYELMVKKRKEQLPIIQATIQKALDNYEGQSIVLIVSKEDENGHPIGHDLVMAGVSRMECQFSMAESLDKAARTAIEVLMDSCKDDPKAIIQLVKVMSKIFKEK